MNSKRQRKKCGMISWLLCESEGKGQERKRIKECCISWLCLNLVAPWIMGGRGEIWQLFLILFCKWKFKDNRHTQFMMHISCHVKAFVVFPHVRHNYKTHAQLKWYFIPHKYIHQAHQRNRSATHPLFWNDCFFISAPVRGAALVLVPRTGNSLASLQLRHLHYFTILQLQGRWCSFLAGVSTRPKYCHGKHKTTEVLTLYTSSYRSGTKKEPTDKRAVAFVT